MSGACVSKFPKDHEFFSSFISSFCKKENVVMDAFTGGFSMREALRMERNTIVFVSNLSKRELLESYASMMVTRA